MASEESEPVGDDRPSPDDVGIELPKAPDGGWGWFCVLACALMHMITAGAGRSGGILFLVLQDTFDRPATDIAWIISISATLRLLLGPVVSALCNRFSCRSVAFTGALMCALGFILSSLVPKYEFLIFSHGIVYGIGRGLVYTPTVVTLGFYFDKRRSLATGLGTAGSGIGTLFMPPLVEALFGYYGFFGAMLMMAGMMLHLCISSSLLRPIEHHYKLMLFARRQKQRRYTENDVAGDMLQPSEKKQLHKETPIYTGVEDENNHTALEMKAKSDRDSPSAETQKTSPNKSMFTKLKSMFSFSLLKNSCFVCFCFSVLLYNASTKIVLTFLPAMAKDNGIGSIEAALLLSIFGGTDFVGRISSAVMDAKALKPYRRYIYIAFPGLLGITAFLFTVTKTMTGYGILIAFMGLFVGLFVSQKSVIIVDLLGPGKLLDGFGLVCMFQGLGILAGPPIAGYFRDYFHSFNESFYLGGSTFFASSIVMVLGNVIAQYQRRKSK